MSQFDERSETGAERFDRELSELRLPGNPAFSIVARVACFEWATWPDELLGRSRVGHVVQTRRVAWHLAHRVTQAPAEEIGEAFGGYRAATVMPFLRTVELLEALYPAQHNRIVPRIEEMRLKVEHELKTGESAY